MFLFRQPSLRRAVSRTFFGSSRSIKSGSTSVTLTNGSVACWICTEDDPSSGRCAPQSDFSQLSKRLTVCRSSGCFDCPKTNALFVSHQVIQKLERVRDLHYETSYPFCDTPSTTFERNVLKQLAANEKVVMSVLGANVLIGHLLLNTIDLLRRVVLFPREYMSIHCKHCLVESTLNALVDLHPGFVTYGAKELWTLDKSYMNVVGLLFDYNATLVRRS